MQTLQTKIEERLKDAKRTWSVALEDVNKGRSFSLNGNESHPIRWYA